MKSSRILLFVVLLWALVAPVGCKAKPEKRLQGSWRIAIEETAENLESDSEFLYGLTVAGLALVKVAMRFERNQIELVVHMFGAGEYDKSTFEVVEVQGDRITLEIQPNTHDRAPAFFDEEDQLTLRILDKDRLSLLSDDAAEDGGVVFRRIEDEEFQKLVDRMR